MTLPTPNLQPSCGDAVNGGTADTAHDLQNIGGCTAFLHRFPKWCIGNHSAVLLSLAIFLLLPIAKKRRRIGKRHLLLHRAPGGPGHAAAPAGGGGGAAHRAAIVKANCYMVSHSSHLIAYVWHIASNARDILGHAQRRERRGTLRVTLPSRV